MKKVEYSAKYLMANIDIHYRLGLHIFNSYRWLVFSVLHEKK
ncbi:hypothetical protein SLEP1_g40095 [Rubroshorea leprosula]|uniref:Uncharacterized protein n=1 Tax=Rubroshorea leprosula TaxID=152421 RepID=A0AAV5L364_9ROSI|nr:hypothetical protein SLEP1_g40095 [Rubroshorea leprosula]